MFSSTVTQEPGSVLVISGNRPYAFEQGQIRKVAAHFGLDVRSLNIAQPGGAKAIAQAINPGTLGILASVDALPLLETAEILSALQIPEGKRIPMLIFGIGPAEDEGSARLWSGDAILESLSNAAGERPRTLEIHGPSPITGVLGGRQLPAVISSPWRLEVAPGTEQLLSLRDNLGEYPVLLRTTGDSGEFFFTPELQLFDESWIGAPSSLSQAFCSMAPFLMFIRHAAGEYGWHLDGAYANFTIDDPWLTQPYGMLDYEALLAEMETHNFHTTIAFVPWNFERSAPAVVNLFKDHSKRFSICVHGNDHAHREFGDYKTNPLSKQLADIRQGLARMEAFQASTGIPYDRFMVFPHAVSPEETFEVLKRHDFCGTANSSNVPMGNTYPVDPMFPLRPYTVDYASFLSILRYPAEYFQASDVAIHTFLGNPVLFYSHQDIFYGGIDAFNKVAELVNDLEPRTEWVGLGELARHVHLLRRRPDDSFDVRMFSNVTTLSNTADKETTYYVERSERHSPRVRSITVNGAVVESEEKGESRAFRVSVPARGTVTVCASYENDFDVARQDIRRRSPHSFAVRLLSDFRDLYLSRTFLGHRLTRGYYRFGIDAVEVRLERSLRAILAFMINTFRRIVAE